DARVTAPSFVRRRRDASSPGSPTLDTPGGLGETARPLVRVIAGTLRGRRLAAPEGGTTRPTSDRVRESLFMVLGPLDGRRVVDLLVVFVALSLQAPAGGA